MLGCWAFLWLAALPALSRADEYAPPGIGSTQPSPSLTGCSELPEASESEDPVVVELRELRRDQVSSCEAVAARVDDLRLRAWWLVTELVKSRELGPSEATLVALQEATEALNSEAGLPVKVAGQAEPLISEISAPVEVANPTDVSGVEAAIGTNTDTGNQNVWAIFGLLVGFGLLGVIWKLVRP